MNSFWSALVNGALLGGMVAALVSIALRCTSRRALNAATRYAIWWTVLAVTIFLPAIWIVPRADHNTPSMIALQPDGENSGRILWQESELSKQPFADTAISLPIEVRGGQMLRPLLIVWIAVSLLLLMRVFTSYLALYRRSARGSRVPEEFEGCSRHWMTCAGETTRQVRLASSTEVAAPVATGPISPTILIPAQLFDRMSSDDLDQIGIHEAAHLARRDDYALLIQRLIEAVFALHPVVRWVTRQIDLEREIACDDVVANSSGHALSYADCLTRTVALCGRVGSSLVAASAAGSRSHLSRRVELLVGGSRNGTARLLRGRCLAIAAGLVCVVIPMAKTPVLFAFTAPSAGHAAPPVASIAAPLPVSPAVVFVPSSKPHQVLIAQALSHAGSASTDDPTSFAAQLEAGKAQMGERQFDDAIASFRNLLPRASDDRQRGDIWARIGEAYRYKSEFARSIEAMQQATKLVPDNAAYLTSLGLLYEASYDEVLARQYYEKSIAMDPGNALALNNLAYVLTKTGGDLDLALSYALTARQML